MEKECGLFEDRTTYGTRLNHFLSLVPGNHAQIFDFVWGDAQELENRLICKDLLKAIDILIKNKWEDLQKNPPRGPFGLQIACRNIKKKFSVHGCFPENFNHLKLFRSLFEEWSRAKMKIQNGPLNLTLSYQIQLQADLSSILINYV